MNNLSIVWLRRDLRLEDNHALHLAENQSKSILPVFIFDPDILEQLEDKDDARVSFIYETVSNMREKVQQHGGEMLILYGKPSTLIPELIQQTKASALYFNEDYEPYAISRDTKIQSEVEKMGVHCHACKDQVLFAKDEVVKNDGKPYTVFTPYSKKWKQAAEKIPRVEFKVSLDKFIPKEQLNNINQESPPTLESMGFTQSSLEIPERIIRQSTIRDYHQTRDIPSIKGTSRLSLHLRFGTVSARKLIYLAANMNETWLNELIWREFYMMILWHFPQTPEKSFKPAYDQIKWINNKDQFEAWKQGKTGYPLVDAGMRELNQTGFMHNRVRMLTASFLTKHLLIDWRWGERYFARKLLDFELASNVGGWQWAAGSGTDAAPYFRIFSPERQQEKFDPEYNYIRRFIPEYGTETYPKPIVEHKAARERCLAVYRSALQ